MRANLITRLPEYHYITVLKAYNLGISKVFYKISVCLNFTAEEAIARRYQVIYLKENSECVAELGTLLSSPDILTTFTFKLTQLCAEISIK